MTDVVTNAQTVEELTVDQGRALFDRHALHELGVSGHEFLQAYQRGTLPTEWSPEAINRLEMLLPFAR